MAKTVKRNILKTKEAKSSNLRKEEKRVKKTCVIFVAGKRFGSRH